ncbi:hypothetical protein A3860_31790 [Niastella vici]|uniref:Lipocalin-like domain-containing protein n=1 Tax=Niastella vici TaxID=1703345 RepID=A0A1V9FT46_9BACT|nr:hypothetical protein [Niastella vici]OQP61510.1 hypothetical protein A3860_31790 [Niastella vici]
MNDQQLSGKWVGAYSYGADYGEPVKGKTVAFEMEITVVNGIIMGECTDGEATAHFKQPAIIEGSVNDQYISFIKCYPHYWQHEMEGPRFLPKLPSQQINYSGTFVNDRFEGEWEIVTTVMDAQGEAVAYKGVGSWFMKKK